MYENQEDCATEDLTQPALLSGLIHIQQKKYVLWSEWKLHWMELHKGVVYVFTVADHSKPRWRIPLIAAEVNHDTWMTGSGRDHRPSSKFWIYCGCSKRTFWCRTTHSELSVKWVDALRKEIGLSMDEKDPALPTTGDTTVTQPQGSEAKSAGNQEGSPPRWPPSKEREDSESMHPSCSSSVTKEYKTTNTSMLSLPGSHTSSIQSQSKGLTSSKSYTYSKIKSPVADEALQPSHHTSTSSSSTSSPETILERLRNLRLFDHHESQRRLHVKLSDFEIISLLGKGSYGNVLKVRSKQDGQFYAMKIMRKEAITKPKEVMSERSVLQCVDHPFIVRLENAFQTATKLFLILGYLPGGTLKEHLRYEKMFTLEKTRIYAAEILLAVEYLHAQKIVYRDIKPGNIVLDEEGHCVLTDMGLARDLTEQSNAYTFCGTPLYVAPEILQHQGYGFAVDWWSYGVILYEMLVGVTPFAAKSAQTVFQLITTKAPKFPESVHVSARSFVQQLLVKDPALRLTNPTKMKQHAFFEGIDWTQLVQRAHSHEHLLSKISSSELILSPQQVAEILKDCGASAGTRTRPHFTRPSSSGVRNYMGFTFDASQDGNRRRRPPSHAGSTQQPASPDALQSPSKMKHSASQPDFSVMADLIKDAGVQIQARTPL